MFYFPHIVILTQLCVTSLSMFVGPLVDPPPPAPTPKAMDCINKITRQQCNIDFRYLLSLSRPGAGDRKQGLKECCDFKDYFNCVLDHSRDEDNLAQIVGHQKCSDSEIDEVKAFASATMDYLQRYKCPGFKLDQACDKLDHELHGDHGPGHLIAALAKVQASTGYKACVDSLMADSECLLEWNAIKCREEHVTSVATAEEEVVAIREYNDKRIKEIDSSICQNDVLAH